MEIGACVVVGRFVSFSLRRVRLLCAPEENMEYEAGACEQVMRTLSGLHNITKSVLGSRLNGNMDKRTFYIGPDHWRCQSGGDLAGRAGQGSGDNCFMNSAARARPNKHLIIMHNMFRARSTREHAPRARA